MLKALERASSEHGLGKPLVHCLPYCARQSDASRVVGYKDMCVTTPPAFESRMHMRTNFRSPTDEQTFDTLPFVGAVPGHEGLFVSAGFHGHGTWSIDTPFQDSLKFPLLTALCW